MLNCLFHGLKWDNLIVQYTDLEYPVVEKTIGVTSSNILLSLKLFKIISGPMPLGSPMVIPILVVFFILSIADKYIA